MRLHKTISDINEAVYYRAFNSPDNCPICHFSVEPVFIHGYVSLDRSFSVFYYCKNCDKTFISRYSGDLGKTTHKGTEYFMAKLNISEPTHFQPKVFDKQILEVSPKFVEIYNQSLEAKSLNMLEIAGSGYRRALEFLIKDYAVRLHPDKKDEISSPGYTLQRCINDYIKEDSIKDLSTATYWIGNDLTHYAQKHTDQDLDSLLRFLDTTVAYITYQLIAIEAALFTRKS